jgi:hypothetical protein
MLQPVDFSDHKTLGDAFFVFVLNGLRISVLVGLSTQLGLPGQCGRGIFREHDQFDQLHFLSLVEGLVLEKGIQLGLGLDLIRNSGFLILGEGVQELGVLPVKFKGARQTGEFRFRG